MQARDVMTREVVTVGPGTAVKYAAEVMAGRGFAALPVVDDDEHLIGIVAEADLLRERVPADPRRHLRRDEDTGPVPPALIGAAMTADVRTVDGAADIADLARLFLDGGLRSVPVLEHGRLAGIVSRRDLLRTLVRPDEHLRDELLGLVENYTGEPGAYEVGVDQGVATVRRVHGTPSPDAATEEQALREIAGTVGGLVGVRASAAPTAPTASTASTGGTR